jgi:hypothetical protein
MNRPFTSCFGYNSLVHEANLNWPSIKMENIERVKREGGGGGGEGRVYLSDSTQKFN